MSTYLWDVPQGHCQHIKELYHPSPSLPSTSHLGVDIGTKPVTVNIRVGSYLKPHPRSGRGMQFITLKLTHRVFRGQFEYLVRRLYGFKLICIINFDPRSPCPIPLSDSYISLTTANVLYCSCRNWESIIFRKYSISRFHLF